MKHIYKHSAGPGFALGKRLTFELSLIPSLLLPNIHLFFLAGRHEVVYWNLNPGSQLTDDSGIHRLGAEHKTLFVLQNNITCSLYFSTMDK